MYIYFKMVFVLSMWACVQERTGALQIGMSHTVWRLKLKSELCNATLTQWRIYGEWAYICNSPPIRNDHKVIARHS